MIQRTQTLWLLFVSILGLTSLKTSFYSGHRINDAAKTMNFVNGSYSFFLTVATTAVVFISLINIFLYKNRKLQIRLGIVTFIISILTLLLYYWQSKSFIAAESSYDLTSVIPMVIPVLLILAIRGIWKDERLIKSSDRLR